MKPPINFTRKRHTLERAQMLARARWQQVLVVTDGFRTQISLDGGVAHAIGGMRDLSESRKEDECRAYAILDRYRTSGSELAPGGRIIERNVLN